MFCGVRGRFLLIGLFLSKPIDTGGGRSDSVIDAKGKNEDNNREAGCLVNEQHLRRRHSLMYLEVKPCRTYRTKTFGRIYYVSRIFCTGGARQNQDRGVLYAAILLRHYLTSKT